jgi:hypothetical protein
VELIVDELVRVEFVRLELLVTKLDVASTEVTEDVVFVMAVVVTKFGVLELVIAVVDDDIEVA